MPESEKPRLEAQTELLVRDLVETHVAQRLDGYGQALKYAAGAAAAVFAVLGLKTCTDIEAGAKSLYEQQVKERLSAVDASSETARYQKRLANLYRRGLIDSAILRIQRADRAFHRDTFADPQFSTDELDDLVQIANLSDTTGDDFKDTVFVLERYAAIAPESQSIRIASSLTASLRPESAGLAADRREAVILSLARLRYKEAARDVRKVLADSAMPDSLRVAAARYLGRIRDAEAVEHLGKLLRSDDEELANQARAALAVIQPTHDGISKWRERVTDASSVGAMAGALRVAAELSRSLSDSNHSLFAATAPDNKTEWEVEAGTLLDSLLGVACSSPYSLRPWPALDDADDEDEFPSKTPATLLLTDLGKPGPSYGISSWLVVGRQASQSISSLLKAAMSSSGLEAARLLRFFGATDEPSHLTDVVVRTARQGRVKVSDGRVVDATATSEVILLADPMATATTILAYWRDVAGYTQRAEFVALEGAEPAIRLRPK